MIEELVSFGVYNIELSGNLIFYRKLEQDLMFLKQKYGLNILIHNYFPPVEGDPFVLNLASEDEVIKSKSLELMRNAARLMDKAVIPLYSAHGGYLPYIGPPGLNRSYFTIDERKITDRDRAVKTIYENIDFIMNKYFKDGHRLAIENGFPFSAQKKYSLFSEPLEIINFINYSSKFPNLGFLLDLGHLAISAQVCGFDKTVFAREILLKHPDKIYELHVSENDGSMDEHNMNLEDSWQISILRQFPQIIQRVPVVFEWRYNGNTREICEHCHRVGALINNSV